MIFHPPILALILASAVSTALVAWAGVFAVRLLRRWNLASGSEQQLQLERQTHLVSTVVAFVMIVELCSLVLFVFNADRMAVMFAGAMCAVGTLNASSFGFPALLAKIAVFFAGSLWLAVNSADGRGRDYPLIRLKYKLLFGVAPLVALAGALQLAYFLDIRADTITSCCGKLFAPEKTGLAAEIAGLDERLALALLYGALAANAAAAYAARRSRAAMIAYGVSAALFFAVALAAVISVISLYVYEHPHHHCPFCLLKREYGYFGFALYAPLFAGTAAGLAAGFLAAIPAPDSLRATLPALARRFLHVSLACFLIFGALATAAIATSRLVLFG